MLTADKENKMRERIRELRERGTQLGLHQDEIKALFNLDRSQNNQTFVRSLKTKLLLRKLMTYPSQCKSLVSKKILMMCFVAAIACSMYRQEGWSLRKMVIKSINERCIVNQPTYMSEIIRPQVPCGICKDLKQVPIVFNISREEFSEKYAYTGVPVLIKGATSDWLALQHFSYDYFKAVYTETTDSLDYVDNNCQFFQYQTEFETLDEVFEMDADRAALKNGTKPWYIGWSNCGPTTEGVGLELRSQYGRPYFLPSHSTNMETDWIFMGGPGWGAGMHIDSVERPSWQAQVSGSKTWLLDPSPECWKECPRLEVTVEKGDIIVLDTNIWYHSTRVNPGNISITIGAEYD